MSKYTDFQKLKGDALRIAAQYKEREAYEMAYISIWLVLEKGLRLYADDCVRLNLKDRVSDWSKYLEGRKRKALEPIKSFNTRYTSRSIPPVSLVEKSLGKNAGSCACDGLESEKAASTERYSSRSTAVPNGGNIQRVQA